MQKKTIITAAVILLLIAAITITAVIYQNSLRSSRTATDYDIGYTLTPAEQRNVSTVKIEPLNAITEIEPAEPALTEFEKAENSSSEAAGIYELSQKEYRMISITAVNADFTDDDSMLAVIRVIYNRVYDSRFPDTIEGVLRQKHQFESCDRVANYAKSAYDYEHIKTLIDRVWVEGYDPFEGECALFYASSDKPKEKICKGLYFICEKGGSRFYGIR